MLRWRLLLGTLFTGGLVGLCVADHRLSPPGLLLFPLVCLVTLAGVQEMRALVGKRLARPRAAVVYGGTVWILAGSALALWRPGPLPPVAWPLVALGLAVAWALAVEMQAYQSPGESLIRLAGGILCLVYVPLLISFAVLMRLADGGRQGVLAIASLLLVVKMADIGAYTVGRLVGRHKMAPRLSPGKTLEGAGGALVFAVLGAWLGCVGLPGWLGLASGEHAPSGGWILYGLVVGAAGMAGDLAESLIKRDAEQKDSSQWMPGFGGVLDLLDSVLLAAPLAYLGWALGLVGG